MIASKKMRPDIGQKPEKKVQPLEKKLHKIYYFYRYRLPSIYRELRIQIYDVPNQSRIKVNKTAGSQKQIKDFEQTVDILYKKAMLNSKYHHRQKMRFSRTPLLKHIKYDFKQLEQKLKNKKYMKIYDDLEEDDQEDDGKQKIEYEPNPMFSEQSIKKYKKKHGINGKIVIAQGYEDLKHQLVTTHGWTQNQDTSSLIYNLKFMSKKKHLDYVNLLENQVINHFNQNKSVTAKFGLTRNIRNIASINKDPHEFFPRCFDVNDVSELENFFENFKVTFAESLLKLYVSNDGLVKGEEREEIEMGIRKCMKIVSNQLMDSERTIKTIMNKQNLIISFSEWQSLKEVHKKLKKIPIDRKNSLNDAQYYQNQQLIHEVKEICLHAAQSDPQWYLNQQNIWIIKPASMSRGRGIKTFDNIYEILDYVIGKQISWVAQKYIENPLIIKKRKFDIRQWVLLTDFKPFRVWVYEECYIRFCAEIYTPENLKNRKIHLTNNSVTKGSSQLNDGILENMMNEKQFSETIQALQGKQIFKSIIKPQMKRISVETLESVKENIISRKNTFEIFGFDFMIDQNYKVWLIEVNSSPTMEHSTKVTSEIVGKGLSDLADVINNYMFQGKAYNKGKASELYGGWKLLTNP